MASGATAAGSAPILCFTISTPMRCDQIVSCSTAAARNVSPAQTITFLFIWFFKSHASLAMLVVFPAPLIPATRITVGPVSARRSSRFSCPQPDRS